MPGKSFALNWENDVAQIVCADPDFELSDVCRTPHGLEAEARRLEAELWTAINAGITKFVEYF